jgi:dUTP pyrophosphatase
MNKVAKFSKVSYEQFKKDWIDTFETMFYKFEDDEEAIDKTIRSIYDSIELPKRSTSGSAGHDFRSPAQLTIGVKGSIKIPTGIRCKIDTGWVLQVYPRSSYGFKYGVKMANTIPVIDSDYYYANNEGHIFIKLVNDSSLAQTLNIDKGDAFCQGVFLPYGVADDDDVTEVRTGGIGSTGR